MDIKLQVEGQTITVESRTFTARFDGPALVSFVHRGTGAEFCRPAPAEFTLTPDNGVISPPGSVRGRDDTRVHPLELTYPNGDTLKRDKAEQVTVVALSELAARVIVSGTSSDRELFIHLDPATGDLCVKPAGQSHRRGVVSIRWNIAFAREAALVLPCINGLRVTPENPFPASDRFEWPFRWNAQLLIAERNGACMAAHGQDTAYKFKALRLARQDGLATLGLESEQLAPTWDNRTAGGIEWRLNAYDGDWHVPADRYRAWMERAYQLAGKRAARPAWVNDITFSLGWAEARPAVLDALAPLVPPSKTLIHLSHWRRDAYDVNYPDYQPSAEAPGYMEKANGMGYKVMPHFNFFSCYEKHPLYMQVRDWQLRDPYQNEPMGWYYPFDTHDYTRMGYIHPGLALWRRSLIDALLGATRQLRAPAAFIDQTLLTFNVANGLVENMTTVEGMLQMQEEFTAIHPDIVLAGEGCNEISFQHHCFAQAHIHDGWSDLNQHYVDAAIDLGAYLWRGHTRLVGYYHLNPRDKDVDLGIEVYRRMGVTPTLVCNEPELIRADQPVVKRLLELAGA
jgi:hypothetical protein